MPTNSQLPFVLHIKHHPVPKPRPRCQCVPKYDRGKMRCQPALKQLEVWKSSRRDPATGEPILITDVRDFTRAAGLAFMQSGFKGPIDAGLPLRVDVVSVFDRTALQIYKKKPMVPLWHTEKPDRDNVEKLVFDSLTGRLWHDDNQIVAGEHIKIRRAGVWSPCVIVRVSEADQIALPEWATALLGAEPQKTLGFDDDEKPF